MSEPTRRELIELLKAIPPRTAIIDQRYWDFHDRLVQPLLDRLPAE